MFLNTTVVASGKLWICKSVLKLCIYVSRYKIQPQQQIYTGIKFFINSSRAPLILDHLDQCTWWKTKQKKSGKKVSNHFDWKKIVSIKWVESRDWCDNSRNWNKWWPPKRKKKSMLCILRRLRTTTWKIWIQSIWCHIFLKSLHFQVSLVTWSFSQLKNL